LQQDLLDFAGASFGEASFGSDDAKAALLEATATRSRDGAERQPSIQRPISTVYGSVRWLQNAVVSPRLFRPLNVSSAKLKFPAANSKDIENRHIVGALVNETIVTHENRGCACHTTT
jgi:hypothetical protein